MTVKLGMFMMPLHPPTRDLGEVLDEDRQAVILADRLGFSEAWCGEHFTSTAEPVPSPLMFFASLAHATRDIKFATGVLNLPQKHPAVVAAEVAMLDHLSGGRYLMGIGPGGLGSDFELMGLHERGQRDEMMQESIQTILEIWRQDAPYDIPGKHWPVKIEDFVFDGLGIGQMLKPKQQPHPPILLSVVTPNSASAREAGRRGWWPVSVNFVQPRYVASHWDAYAEGAAEVGGAPDRGLWRVARSILVTESDGEADDYLADTESAPHFYFRYFRTLYTQRGVLDFLKPDVAMNDAETTVEAIARSMITWGSPDTVLDKLVAMHDDLGDFGTLLMVGHDWDRPVFWQRSMRLLAEEVMPRFNAHVAQARAGGRPGSAMGGSDIDGLVDTVRYPFGDLEGGGCHALLTRGRRAMAEVGSFNLGGFLRPDAVDRAVREVEAAVSTGAHRHEARHNIYFSDEDDGTRATAHTGLTSSWTLAGDLLAGGVLDTVYRWPALAGFLARLFGKPALQPMADPLACLNAMRYEAGDGLGWHFDRADFSVTVLLRAAGAGGAFEYRRNLRGPGDDNRAGVARLLAGDDPDVAVVPLAPGTLNIFAGYRSAHRVTPVTSAPTRLISVLSFVERENVVFSDADRQRFYGRAVPI